MKKFKWEKLWGDRRFLLLLSLGIAVLLWLYVTMSVMPNTSTTLSGVPVDFDYDSAKYTTLGLDIVNEPSYTVDLSLSGDGSVLGAARASDFVVYPDYSSVKGAGSQILNLNVKIINPDLENRVTATIERGRRTVDVVFDTILTKTLPVTVETSGLHIAEGYSLNKVSSSPSEITITGPSTEVSQVTAVVAPLSMEGELSESQLVQVPLEMRDANGKTLDLPYTTMEDDIVDVTVSVYKQVELPLVVNFINVPSYFDVNTLQYSLSQETLLVSGPERVVNNLTELSVGSFDLSTFSLDKDYQMNVELPDGIVSNENVSSVTLSFDTTGMSERSFNVSQISVINVPANYQVEVTTKRINNVVLVGPEEDLEQLSAGSIEARINAEDLQVAVGTQTVAVQIQVPSNPRVFAIGTYTVTCNITSR
ncbi:hypothetical protein B5E65_15040 [Gemmiger sp. An120]|uniref:CdaR family protein n=1 Tax=Gemmiger sp. An120 TaxID=1965549 RepID=UPI000B3969B3|nr:CdaR family protein [Gemmiger sp. An120]OUQ39730.1 hypothetical protein B5E65_15040 [Gemmiger sp. An120]